jgi:hypothetical protein
MAAAMTHPDVMSLTPPQLAAFVGALQCSDLLKRPEGIWSSFPVSSKYNAPKHIRSRYMPLCHRIAGRSDRRV